MFVKPPAGLLRFPALLLVATLFRLALNVSATRLVLLDGYAGKVIDAFGHFVVGGSLVVGLVVFLILDRDPVRRGHQRRRARRRGRRRFTLDGMPGKQMAIDADLNAGLIDEEARQAPHRGRLPRPTSTARWTAPPSSSRATRSPPSSSPLINLVGGFATSACCRRAWSAEAIETYSLLTVGDGLVSQIPALLLSVATGLIVTRPPATATWAPRSSPSSRQQRRRCGSRRGRGGPVPDPGLPKLPFLLVGASPADRGSRGCRQA